MLSFSFWKALFVSLNPASKLTLLTVVLTIFSLLEVKKQGIRLGSYLDESHSFLSRVGLWLADSVCGIGPEVK